MHPTSWPVYWFSGNHVQSAGWHVKVRSVLHRSAAASRDSDAMALSGLCMCHMRHKYAYPHREAQGAVCSGRLCYLPLS